MKKETFTDKMMKRFYGIVGPLDEYKRREIDRIGNICFILLFSILLFGNLIALLLSDQYPKAVAFAYPSILTLCIFVLLSFIIYRIHKMHLVDFDEEELTKKELKQLHFAGLKAGLNFGILMWLFNGILNLIDHVPLLQSFFSVKSGVLFIFHTGFMGVLMHFYLKLHKKSTNKEKD
ncbi:DUF3278 domain-containing protein [Streptococcus himalayensis]|uniref:Membrane protein n=1 Tax=Streptococcus himalayensis TaxID=1888195 RepID=A0A917A959_9STRE|nr:DUF3278 domain-containing protein [Streptococcus himalayensis]GGE36749.1 membrane protein [Streptococcus himalayensis]